MMRFPRVFIDFQGNLDERVTDAIVWELMLQAGPVGQYSSIANQWSLMNFVD